MPLCAECPVYQLAESSMWVVPACTWDKGECQCHPAPPRDSRDRDAWQASAQDPHSVDLQLLWMLLQKASEKGETAECWKVVFVSGPCRHTVVQSLVQLDAFSHWQNACVMEAGPYSHCCKYTAGFTPKGRSQCLKETVAFNVCFLSRLNVETSTQQDHLKSKGTPPSPSPSILTWWHNSPLKKRPSNLFFSLKCFSHHCVILFLFEHSCYLAVVISLSYFLPLSSRYFLIKVISPLLTPSLC